MLLLVVVSVCKEEDFDMYRGDALESNLAIDVVW